MANYKQEELEKLRQGLGKQLRQRNTCLTSMKNQFRSPALAWKLDHGAHWSTNTREMEMAGSLLLASLTAFRSCRLGETLPKTKGDVGCRPLACTQVCSCFSAMNSVAPP